MPQAFHILFGACLTIATCLAIGRLLLRAIPIELHRVEEDVLGFVVGSACLSFLVFLTAAAGIARKGVFVSLAAAILTLAYRRGAHRSLRKALPVPASTTIRLLFVVIFAAFTILYFFNAMAPETSADGTAYHLGFVNRYLRQHGFSPAFSSMYGNMPEGIEMLFLFAFSIGRHSAAALVHFAYLVALALGILCYAKRMGFPLAGYVAALFVYCSPVVGRDGTCAYNDVALACIVFALFYLLQLWKPARKIALLVPIGLVAGFAYATKYTGFLAVPYALAFVGWNERRVKSVLVVAFCALLMMAPWMLKNIVTVQNPFAPFFNSIFPNPHMPISFEKFYVQGMRHDQRLKGWWAIPWEVTVRGGYLVGILGPLFLLAPLALLALRDRAGRQVLLGAAVFLSTYPANIATRFLILALPFLALAMAMVFLRWRWLAVVLLVAHAVASWPGPVLRSYVYPYIWALDKIPIRPALRIEKEDAYLTRTWPNDIGLARMIEAHIPLGKRALSFTQAPESYTTRDILVNYEDGFNSAMEDVLWTAVDPNVQPTWLATFRFPPQRLRKIRAVETATGADMWSIGEFQAFRSGALLPRSPQWRLRAHPYPWGVEYAFDNNPMTRWRSWQDLFNGMFVEVDFGAAQTVDSVVLAGSHDQWKTRLRLEGQTASGVWRTLADAPQYSEGKAPPAMRRLATLTLKQYGIDYLIVPNQDFRADEFAKKSAEWGITLVGQTQRDKLYQIEW